MTATFASGYCTLQTWDTFPGLSLGKSSTLWFYILTTNVTTALLPAPFSCTIYTLSQNQCQNLDWTVIALCVDLWEVVSHVPFLAGWRQGMPLLSAPSVEVSLHCTVLAVQCVLHELRRMRRPGKQQPRDIGVQPRPCWIRWPQADYLQTMSCRFWQLWLFVSSPPLSIMTNSLLPRVLITLYLSYRC